MRALDRKLFRDIARMKGQTLAVSLVMACGLAMMVMSRSLIHSLEATRDAYYERYRFADLFCSVKRAPNAVESPLARISGVAAVQTRISFEVTLDLPGMMEPASGRILSIPRYGAPALNQLFLRRGRLPDPGNPRETVVGEAFALAHALQPGDTVPAILNGRWQKLTIVGIGLSPEFVFEARAGETLPDNRRFGVFWMRYNEVAAAFNLEGAFNDVTIDLAPGVDPAGVIADIDRLLEPYGGLSAYSRADHASAVRLHDELQVLRTLSIGFPLVFLSVAAFMVNAVLSRLIRLQREQIAQLKAFGYSSRQVGFHYLQFALVIVALGTVIGTIGGIWLGANVVQVYTRFFRFPALAFHLDFSAILLAFTVSSGAAFLGVIGAVRQAIKLPPAEAMRPEPPADFKPSLLERAGLAQYLGVSFRMAQRNIERRPWQAFFTLFGLALATGILIVPGAMKDGVDYILEFQWDLAMRQDATVSLFEPGSSRAFSDLRHLPGVTHAEAFRQVPARLRFGHRSRRLAVTGLNGAASLNRVLDRQGRVVPLPADGVVLSRKLAEVLGAEVGDELQLEVQEGARPVRRVTIRGLVADFAGVAAYMEIGALHRLMREGNTINGAYLTVDSDAAEAFFARVKESPRAAGIVMTDSLRQSFRKTTAESISMIQNLYLVFATIVAFGVIYNSARIALSERSRDLATLRVIGFTHREVAGVLVSELAAITLAAIPVGFAFGSLLARGILSFVDTETVRLPLILSAHNYGHAALVVLVSAVFSFWMVSRQLHSLDLIGVLKARD